jgi:demethoxyubiquinone hydroxylase (CLK1/Coq7/Cat5 family)
MPEPLTVEQWAERRVLEDRCYVRPSMIIPMLYLAAFVVGGARPLGIRVQVALAWSLARFLMVGGRGVPGK